MADGPRIDRFAPPLMQVFRESFRSRDSEKQVDLRDEHGERVVSGRRSSPRRAATESSLRENLSEDLGSLLNTVNLASSINLEGLDHVRKSIINFGLDDLSAITVDEIAVDSIGNRLKSALSSFEPRLVSGTLEVKREGRPSDHRDMKVKFSVRADMHATPVDVPLDFIAELHIDSAKMKISKL